MINRSITSEFTTCREPKKGLLYARGALKESEGISSHFKQLKIVIYVVCHLCLRMCLDTCHELTRVKSITRVKHDVWPILSIGLVYDILIPKKSSALDRSTTLQEPSNDVWHDIITSKL